jgi:transposase
MIRKHYPSDLSEREWAIVGPLIPQPKTNGRHATISRRELLDAMFYVTKTGCGWEWLPHDFPHYKTVYLEWDASSRHYRLHDIVREFAQERLEAVAGDPWFKQYGRLKRALVFLNLFTEHLSKVDVPDPGWRQRVSRLERLCQRLATSQDTLPAENTDEG